MLIINKRWKLQFNNVLCGGSCACGNIVPSLLIEGQLKEVKVLDGEVSLKSIREKYNV